MWSDTFLEDDKWMKIRNVIPKPILENWNNLSEGLKRQAVKRCAQRLIEEESTSSKIIDHVLREVVDEKAFKPPVSPEDIPRLIPKPTPFAESLIPMEKADPGVPGEIVVDENGQLLKRYLQYTNFTRFLKESYDHWLHNELVPRIRNQKIRLDEGVIRFKDVKLLTPSIGGGNPLYPRMARERGITYDLAIHATIFIERNLEGETKIIPVCENRLIGRIPLMLGSGLCYLKDLSPAELRRHGEDPSDPFGYFVVSGSEKVVLLHEKLRLNRIFVISKKRGKEIYPETNITVETANGSARVNLIFDKSQRINFQTRFKADIRPTKGKVKDLARRRKMNEEAKKRQTATSKKDGNYRHIGVEKLFYVLKFLDLYGEGFEETDAMMVNTDEWPLEMSRRIMQFTKPEWRKKVDLKASILKFLYPQDNPIFVFQDIAITKGGADVSDFQSVKDVVLELIDRELFPQLNTLKPYKIRDGPQSGIYGLKSDMLAMMCARLIEVSAGLSTYDDRDSWSNKRLETASRAMNQLFSAIWRKYISAIKKGVADKKISSIPTAILAEKSNITEIFESSFKGDNWGVQGSMRSNMTQKVNRDSVVSLYSHMHRIEVATNRNDKQPSIRMIHGTQFGYVCVTGDTKVSIDGYNTRPIKEIQDGDIVLTVSKDDLSESPSRIKNSFDLIPSSLLQITTITGRTIKCTPDHPFLVTRRDKLGREYRDWVRAGEMKVGDCVVVKVEEKEEYELYRNRMVEIEVLDAFIGKYGIVKDKMALPIESIKEVPIEKVYDFETLHTNHSFIANGFVTHNCPVESPEGQHCLKIGSQVETPSGPVRIELLKDGDEVICVDPVTHEREVTEIHSCFIKPAEVFDLEVVGGKSITATSDHPFLVQGNEWKMLGDLNVGDSVYVQYDMSSQDHQVLEYISKHYDGKGFFLPITSITPKGEEMVCDFTTVSDHHSFVSNGFVTHNCGIVKNLAVTAQVTYNKPDHNVILEVLSAKAKDGSLLFSVEPSGDAGYTSPVLVNGKFLGWCDGSRLRRHLMLARRKSILPEDMGITLNSRNNLLIHTDTSRLVRPLLVVEPKTTEEGKTVYEPLIKTKGLLGASTSTLFREGVIEYVDSFEVESPEIFVAETFENVEEREKSLIELVTWSQELTEKLKLLKQGVEGPENSDDIEDEIESLTKEIERNEAAIKKLRNKRPFSHVEMDPTSIMGISANIIPYPNHNQAPRNTYQCLKEDTQVWMSDGTQKAISDIRIGDSVWSFNPKTMKYETTLVVNHFVKSTTKKIYEIETVSGRKITATYDHKFWTSEGWKCVEEFNTKTTKLAVISPEIPPEKDKRSMTLFVPIKGFIEVENCMIADITTKSENHSFVANGFCVHNSSMAKQALGIMRAHHMACFDGKHKVLAYPTRPLFEPQLNQLLNLNAYPQGEMVWVAFGTFTGDTQEDAVVWNRASIDLGKFRFFKFNNIRVSFKINAGGKVEKLQLPEGLSHEQRNTTFKHINANGLPNVGAHIEQRQVVIGKVVFEGKEQKADESVRLGYGEEGIVDRVSVTENGAETIATVRLRLLRIPIEGDKFAPRNAQKGTIGRILEPEDMPYTEEGIIPDVIVNPHSMPSRMTMTYVMEMIASKSGAIRGERQNATAFRKFEEEEFRSVLRDYGYQDNGYHVMYSGKTGKKLNSLIYSGPVYFQALKHHVKDKIQARRQGPINATSRQPVKGRAKMGGLRFGEMERNAAIAHGAAYFTQERLCGVSDCYKAVYCKCGQVASRRRAGKKDTSSGYRCRRCGDNASFAYLETTAALRLLNMFLSTFGFLQTLDFDVREQRTRMVSGGYIDETESITEFRGFEGEGYEGGFGEY